jgi:hypothetical protein
MLKQESGIKENIHVLLLWRSYYQEGRVAFGIPLIIVEWVNDTGRSNDFLYLFF